MKPTHVKLTIQGNLAGERADKVLAGHLRETSRSRVQEAFAQEKVWLNNEAVVKSHRVAAGDVLVIELPAPPPSKIEAVAGDLTVLFEDEDLLVINKGAGVVMHPGAGTGDDTLAHFAQHHTGGNLSKLGGERRPGIVHRLDKDTSGAVVLAKSDRAYLALIKMFAEREIHKEYLALVRGVPDLRSGSILEPIGRNPIVRVKMAVVQGARGKPAHTDWSVEEIFGKRAALVRCWLHTGRTHQIRVHLAHLEHPLLGDLVYGWKPGANDGLLIKRTMLHAAVLAFPHPADGRALEFRSPPPADFLAVAAQLRELAGRDAKTQVVKRMEYPSHTREVQ